jgi:molecular chaperone GrpE
MSAPTLVQELEEDLRRLMREAAAGKLAAAEQERRHAEESRKRLLSVVAVLDAFDRVFASVRDKEHEVTPQMKVWLGNFRTVRRLVERVLADEGVTRMEDTARGFDPACHVAAEVVEDPGRADGTVVDEIQPGYLWRGEVLRKAQLRVVRND